MVDWYFLKNGLHAQGGLAIAQGQYKPDNPDPNVPEYKLSGGALTLGIGYDFRISKSWGLGGLFRMDIISLKQSGVSYQSGNFTVNDDRTLTGVIPAILLTATYF